MIDIQAKGNVWIHPYANDMTKKKFKEVTLAKMEDNKSLITPLDAQGRDGYIQGKLFDNLQSSMVAKHARIEEDYKTIYDNTWFNEQKIKAKKVR